MSSKWQGLKARYPSRSAGDDSFQARVEFAKDDFRSLELKGLLVVLAQREEKKDQLEAWVKELNVEIAAVERLILERFENNGVTSVRSDAGITFYEKIDPLVSVRDPLSWQAHLDAHPELEYLKQVQPQKLKSFVSELLDEGRDAEIPEGLEVNWRSSVGMRRG